MISHGFARSHSKILLICLLLAWMFGACQPDAANLPASPTEAMGPELPEEIPESRFLKNVEAVSLNRIGLSDVSAPVYQFLVVGHIYGSFEDGALHPAETLVQNLPVLKTRALTLMVSLGDAVRNATESDFEDLEEALFRQVDFPILNAVGNHDMRDRELYQSRYGMTYFAFRYGPSLMIVLDTELDTCNIHESQREMLAEAVAQATNDPDVQQIFIFLHKAVFANDEVLYESQSAVTMPNEWICYNSTNYPNIVTDILLPAAAVKPIYVFAGDVGATGGNLSPFYHQYEQVPLTEIAIGIGDKPEDAALVVSVDNDRVNFELVSLTGREMRELTDYDLDYWREVATK